MLQIGDMIRTLPDGTTVKGRATSARIPKETYDKLLTSYREAPGAHVRAAKEAGVARLTARKAFERGWDMPAWARPIRQVLEEEKEQARIQLARMNAKEAGEHRRYRRTVKPPPPEVVFDAVMEKAREAKAIQVAMTNAITTLHITNEFKEVAEQLSVNTVRSIMRKIRDQKISEKKAIALLQQIVLLSERSMKVLRHSMEALRLHVGDPEKIIQVVESSSMKKVDGQRALEALGADTLERAIVSLCKGEITEDARRFLTWQAEQPATVGAKPN